MAYNIVVERDGGDSGAGSALPTIIEDKISLERYGTADIPGDLESDVETPDRHLDWRFGKMQVSSLDPTASGPNPSSNVSANNCEDDSICLVTGEDGIRLHSGEVTPGGTRSDPLKSVFMGYGVIRMFRDVTDPEESTLNTDDGTVLAILAVPSYMLPGDLVTFITPQTCRDISHIRIVSSSGIPERYLALIKFRDSSSAQKFYLEFNGKEFNSMAPETCHVVYVKSVSVQSSRASDRIVFPFWGGVAEDQSSRPLFNDADAASGSRAPVRRESYTRARRTSSIRSDKRPLVEMPTCPVCLERMDSNITGLLTILCQHTFHCHCLSKWGESSCPVCRYSHRSGEQDKTSHGGSCTTCGAQNNLWVCLICGNTGCGRYDNAHAWDHFKRSGHCYAMDVSTQRVWDYAGDNFVHRLIQNQSDGKLVELPSASGKGNKASDDDDGVVGLKYVYLMTSQLESQREYYESLCASANEGAADSERRALATERENASLKTELEELRREKDSYVPQLEKELEKLREKYERLDALTHKLQDNYAEEKSMSKRLIAKLELLTEEKKTHEATISDLNEQIRDLMFYLDARNKLSDAGEDVQQGSVVVPVSKGKGRRKR